MTTILAWIAFVTAMLKSASVFSIQNIEILVALVTMTAAVFSPSFGWRAACIVVLLIAALFAGGKYQIKL